MSIPKNRKCTLPTRDYPDDVETNARARVSGSWEASRRKKR